jgi:hypothetical protein
MSGSKENFDDVNELSDDERHVEQLLAALPLRESRINRDETMFQAGRASASAAQHSRAPRLRRWKMAAGTICAAAAGLLAGILISAPQQRADVIPPPTGSVREKAAESPLPIASEPADRNGEVAVGESPSLLDLRLGMLRRAGDELWLAQIDSWAPAESSSAGGPSERRRPIPATYGSFAGRLLEAEEHQ